MIDKSKFALIDHADKIRDKDKMRKEQEKLKLLVRRL